MKVKVRGIPKDGFHLEKNIEPVEIGLTEDDMVCLEPLSIAIDLERIGNAVVAEIAVTTKVGFSCTRCLEEIEKETTGEYKFEYEVDERTEFIDLGEDIRQEMLINQPVKILCREDCKGICLHCGANLNEEDCSCGK